MNTNKIIFLNKNQRLICTKDVGLIKCIEGTFWITYQYGKDIILYTGEIFDPLNKKDIIIQVLNPGKIYLEKKARNNFKKLLFNKYKFQKVS